MKHLLSILIITTIAVYVASSNNIAIIRQKLEPAVIQIFHTLEQGICAQIILNDTVRQMYLSNNIIGRVEPVGTFLSPAMALEYLYGLLCEIPNLPPRRDVLKRIDVLNLDYSLTVYRVSFKVQVTLVSKSKLIFFGMLAFDEELKLCGYEAVIQNLGLTLDFPSSSQDALIAQLCPAVQIVCPVNTSLEQYADVNECISFLSEPNTPFGTYDRADQNNVVCRLTHVQLAQINPIVHCPHLGKDGGGACTNKTAASYFKGITDFVQCAHKLS